MFLFPGGGYTPHGDGEPVLVAGRSEHGVRVTEFSPPDISLPSLLVWLEEGESAGHAGVICKAPSMCCLNPWGQDGEA